MNMSLPFITLLLVVGCTCKEPDPGPVPPAGNDTLQLVRTIDVTQDSGRGGEPGFLHLTPQRQLLCSYFPGYFSGAQSTIYSINLDSGLRNWKYNAWNDKTVITQPESYEVENNNIVITDNSNYILATTSGDLKAIYKPTNGYLVDNLIVSLYKGLVYTTTTHISRGSLPSYLIRYNVENPQLVDTLFTILDKKPLSYSAVPFHYSGKDYCYFAVLSYADDITDLYCYNITDRKLQWKLEDFAPTFRHYKPVLTPEGHLLCQASGGGPFRSKVISLDVITGKLIWEKEVPGQVPDGPAFGMTSRLFLDGDRIAYFIHDKLIILNRHSGTVLNTVNDLDVPLIDGTVFEHRLIAYQNRGRVYGFDLRTGKILFKIGEEEPYKGSFNSGQVVVDEKERIFYIQALEGKVLGYKIPWQK